MKERWRRGKSELVYDAGIFRLRRDTYEHRGEPTHDYYVLESPPWVNVVAVTGEGHLVLVRQFRHALGEVTLEVPGGLVDAKDASPEAAAARELLEETGYAADRLVPLGELSNNPAILTNRTHAFYASRARKVAEPRLDRHEDIEVVLEPAAEVPRLLREGRIHHALSVGALALHLLRGRGDA